MTLVTAIFKRLGFRKEAHHVEHRRYKGGWTSEFEFALLAWEWVGRTHSDEWP